MAITLKKIADALLSFSSFKNGIKNDFCKNRNICFNGINEDSFGAVKATEFMETFFYITSRQVPYGNLILKGSREKGRDKNVSHEDINNVLKCLADESQFFMEVDFIEKLIRYNIYYSMGKLRNEANEHPRFLNEKDRKIYDKIADLLAIHLSKCFKTDLETSGIITQKITCRNVDAFVVFLLGTAVSAWEIELNNRHQEEIAFLQNKIKKNIIDFAYKNGFFTKKEPLESYFQELTNKCLELQYKKSQGAKKAATLNPFANGDLKVKDFFEALVPQRFQRKTPLKSNGASPVRLYISSGSGSGKSTFINSVCLLTCARQLNTPLCTAMKQNYHSLFGDEGDKQFIPILVLASDANDTEKDYRLEDLFLTNQTSLRILEQYLSSPNLLLLIDGLDEVTQAKLPALLSKIQAFIETHEQVNVVITSRFVGKIPALGLADFASNKIEDFEIDDIICLSEKALSRANAAKFVEYCKKNTFIKEFVCNPFKLTIAIDYFDNNGDLQLTDLIHYYIERHYFARQDELQQLFCGLNATNTENKKLYFAFLRNVAFDFVAKNTAEVTPEHLKELLRKVMPDLFCSTPAHTPAGENATVPIDYSEEEKQLIWLQQQSATGLEDSHIQTIKSISIVSGILLLNKENLFEFQDNLVMDYLAATRLAECINHALESEGAEHDNPASLVSRYRNNPVSIAYAVGIIAGFFIKQKEQIEPDDICFSKDFLTAAAMAIADNKTEFLVQSGLVNALGVLYRHTQKSTQKEMIDAQMQYVKEKKYGTCKPAIEEQLEQWGNKHE